MLLGQKSKRRQEFVRQYPQTILRLLFKGLDRFICTLKVQRSLNERIIEVQRDRFKRRHKNFHHRISEYN